jgi:Tfp pilus assembly protein PilF
VLNNYAYYLSERNEQLEKADEMSKRSNALSPNQSTYEDTYAWILYKKGNFRDAKVWIEKAINNGAGTNGTILEHYGDIIYKLGEIDKAVEYWEKAKATGDHSELLVKKLTDRKLYE